MFQRPIESFSRLALSLICVGNAFQTGCVADDATAESTDADAEIEQVLSAPGHDVSNRVSLAGSAALEHLGKHVFFDPISQPGAQACASCHVPTSGWTGGSSSVNLTQVAIPGADPSTAGGRKPPTSAYATFSPNFGNTPGRVCSTDVGGIACRGGLFWDGRATGTQIGAEVFAGDPALASRYAGFLGPAADQALGPFGNPVEMNAPAGDDDGLPGAEFVCRHVAGARYAELFTVAWGEPIQCDAAHVAVSFKRIAVAIAAWERSREVNSFSSKRDIALAYDTDDTPGEFPLRWFSDTENLGHDLFYGLTSAVNPTGKNARCAACHSVAAGSGGTSTGSAPDELYTDERYHNIGVPPNYDAASFDPEHPDLGLAMHTDRERVLAGQPSLHAGMNRTPTLRNVDKRPWRGFVKAYMHNGYFKSLEDVVHFYNTATAKLDPVRCPAGTTATEARARDCWPAPEVAAGRPAVLVGNLGLTDREEAALVAYLRTLSDLALVLPPL